MNSTQASRHLYSLLLATALVIGRATAFAQAPPNDNLANATVLTGTNATAAATTAGAAAEPGEPAHAGYPAVHSIWFIWTAPADGSTLIDLSGSASGTHLAVYVGKYLDSLTLVSSNAFGNLDGTGRCVFHTTAGALYDIAVDVSGAPGPVELSLQFAKSYFPPQITQQPSNQSVVEGATATFRVVATSDAPIFYQWIYNWSNSVVGATNSVLVLTNVSLSQAGQYEVVVSNVGGSVASSNANLNVLPRPPNDDFANRILLTGNAATTTGSDVYATAESGEPNHAGWSSPQSVWWAWTAPATGLAFVDVTNYVGNQVLAIYTGNSLTQLVSVASASWFSGPLAVQFQVAGGTNYQIAVAGVGGSSGTFQLDLSFVATNFPPTISQQPVSQTVLQGATVAFRVVAVSGLPMSYQWRFNGSPIAGATSSSLVLTNVMASQAGSYLVIVSNAGGSTPSTNATLVVNVPPSNDDFANRSVLSGLDVTTTGNNQFATSEPGEPAHGGHPPGASVWWTWTTPSIGDAHIDVSGFSGAETLGVYAGSVVSNLTLVASNAWDQGPLSIHFAATNPGTAYQIAVADPNGNGGSFQLHTRLALSNFPPVVVQQPPPLTNVIVGQTLFLQWLLQSDFPVTGQWFFDGGPIGGGSLIGGGGGGGGGDFTGTLELDNVTTNQAGTYTEIWTCYGGSVTNTNTVVVWFPPSNDNFADRITLSGEDLTTAGTTLHATLEPGEPPYTGLTSGGSVWWTWTAPVAGTAAVNVSTTNGGPQVLQIFTGNALTNLVAVAHSGPGQNPLSASFVTTAGTTYQVAIVGGDSPFGLGLQFLPATVPPQITQQPADASTPVGGPATFWVGAVGGGALTYQWQFNGTNLASATNQTLSLSNVSRNQDGPYRVIVSNLGGSVTSSVARLTVTLRPVNDNFADRIVLTGTNVTTSGSNQYATSEPGEPSHAGWGAGNSVWWSWTAPSDGRVQVSITNYSGYQVLAIYAGSSLTGLFPVTNSIWFQGPIVSRFNVTSGTAYQIAVAGESSSGGAFELDLAFTSLVFPPQIVQQPLDRVVTEGSSTTNQVVASGAPPLTYQWQFNGTNLPGATNATLVLNPVTTNQAGPYQVLVTNPGGSIMSSVATLYVNPRPPNDDFANRIPLAGDHVATAGSSRFGTSEPNEPAHAGYGPFQSVWWSYTPPLRGIITVDLTNSFYGAVVAVYAGTNLSQLTLVASNAFGNLDGTARTRFLGDAGTAYQIAVQGNSAAISGTIHLSVAGDFPPTIASQPQDEAVAPGEDATFGVTAKSSSPLSYQWLFGSSEIPGATNEVLSLSHVGTNDLGLYSVRVSNDVGSTNSLAAALSFTTVLTGQITDATTGDPLPGVLVWAGSVTNVSDAQGRYHLAGVQGTSLKTDFDASVRSGTAPLAVRFFDLSTLDSVVLRAETNGYSSYTNSDVQITPVQSVTNSFSMSPILAAGTMRLVLNWGAEPRDLDANLVTPVLQGQAYHIYYQTGSRGSLSNVPFAALNVDRTNGFGPETITIGQFFPGTYTYYVHKYAGIGTLAGSGAIVKIYTEAGLGQTFRAPATGDGDFWMVCTIDGAKREVTVVNQILSAGPTNLVQALVKVPNPHSPGTSGGIRPMDLTPGSATFLWNFGDGNKSTLEDPINIYTNPGLYTVTLTVTTTNNIVQSVTKTNFIEVLSPPNQPPSIVSQPTNQTVIAGTTAQFRVVAAGSSPLSYQWFFNRTNALAGATSPTLTVANAQPPNAGGYSVVVTNVAGAATSVVAMLTVLVPPSIVSQPTNQTVIAGTTAQFRVVAAGSSPLSHQWFFNRTNALAGATGATLTVANAQPSTAGGYSVVVANSAGAVTSVVAMLTVLVPPSIISQPANQIVIAGATATFQIAAVGSSPLSYQWFFNQTGALAGATNAMLRLTNVQPAGAGGYSVVVTNSAGAVTSAVATLTVLGPPTIISQPTNQTVIAGATASFQVVAAGSSPLSYQWFFNRTNALAGATSPTLTVANAQPPNAGGYSVVVTNVAGAATSVMAMLTVLVPPSIVSQPTDQTVIAGATARFQVVAAGSSPLSCQWFFNRTNALAGATGATLTVANAQPSNAGGYSVVVTNSAGAVTSVVAALTVLVPPSIVSQPTNQTVIPGGSAAFQVVASGSNPLNYQWFFNQTNALAAATNAMVTLPNVQPGGAGGYSVVVTNLAGAVTSAVASLTVLGPPSIVSQPTNQTVIAGATARFQVVAAGSSPLSYQWFFNRTNALAGATGATFTVANAQPSNAGGYSVVVTNSAGTVTSVVAMLTVLVPPSIISQPANQTVVEGAAARFQVAATGSAPLAYQWFFNQTNALPGATGATLIVANAQPSNAGGYSVVVTNSAGAATSVVAMLTVLVPPSIVSQPTNQTVIAGATARFQVVAAGSSPLSCQWFFNRTNALAGATGATFTVANAQPSTAGGYSVVVTNSAGAVTSVVAALTVLVPPSIVSQPTNQTVIAAATARFQVVAAGSSPLSYQWFFNRTNALAGATGPTLTVANAQPANAGGYSVVVTNSAGAATSAVATLTVRVPPSVSLIQPANGAGFQAGANVTLEAAASDPGGTITQVEFFQGLINLLGVAANPPYSVGWSNVPVGIYSLTATAVGSGGLTSTSAAVVISVTNPAPPGLAITIVSPANYSGFCIGQDIAISAVASNVTGTAGVGFFEGDTLLGTVPAGPYSHTWSGPPTGDYSLTARITDAQGHSAVSPPVLVTVSDQCGEVAIIRAAPDPEIDYMQSYLFGIGLGSHVYDQAELNLQALNSYRVIIWDDLGQGAAPLAPGTVDALAAAYTNGVPLYLIGERLASVAANLPEPRRTTWMGLTHLSTASGRAGDGAIAVQSSISDDKIFHGPFATVTDFAYAGTVDLATNTDANTEVMGTSGGADVLLAYPRLDSVEQGPTPRLFTQQARLAPPASADSTNQLRGLFQNVVYWLLGDLCTDVSIYLTLSASPDPAQVGQFLEFDIQVTAGAECDRTGVLVTNLVPTGVQFVSAHADQGTWSYYPAAREVSFFLGSVSRFASPQLSVTVVPVEAGTITNVAGVRVNGQNLTTNGLVTLRVDVANPVDLTPRLSIALTKPNGYELRLSGVTNVAYEVQISPDLKAWASLTNVPGPEWRLLSRPTDISTRASLFYRARVAP